MGASPPRLAQGPLKVGVLIVGLLVLGVLGVRHLRLGVLELVVWVVVRLCFLVGLTELLLKPFLILMNTYY